MTEDDRDQGKEQVQTLLKTFDDGRATDYEVAFPLLLAAGVRAEFFVNTATIERAGHLTWSQIMEMHRAGMSFQLFLLLQPAFLLAEVGTRH